MSEEKKKEHALTELVYSLDDFEGLNSLAKGKGTEQLKNLLGKNVVLAGIRVYRILREIEDVIGKSPIMLRELKSIERAIIRSQKVPPHKAMIRILATPRTAREVMYGEMIKRKPQRPVDFPLHLLIVYLRKHIQAVAFRPHNRLVADFLSEQDISEQCSPNRISKIAHAANLEELKDVYNCYLEIYEAPALGGNVNLESKASFLQWLREKFNISIEVDEGPAIGGSLSLDSILSFVKESRRAIVNNPTSERDFGLPAWEDFMV